MPTSSTRARTVLSVGDRLPKRRLPKVGGDERPVRGAPRDAAVVVALHDPECEECRAYLAELAGMGDALRIWDATVLAVTDRDAPGLQEEVEPVVDVLIDADAILLDRLQGPAAVTAVADRYGQIFHLQVEDHGRMEPRELEEWLKYLATQCPE